MAHSEATESRPQGIEQHSQQEAGQGAGQGPQQPPHQNLHKSSGLLERETGRSAEPFEELVALLAKLPGVGERTATRFTFFVLRKSPEFARSLGRALYHIHDQVKRCQRCGNFGSSELCRICADTRRDSSLLCVVASVQDLLAIERSQSFRGRYHVLHALLAPLDGIGPEELPLDQLMARIAQEGVQEVILATPLTVEGEATALYIGETLGEAGIQATRIAAGVPHGGELEYADQITLGRALSGRKHMGA